MTIQLIYCRGGDRVAADVCASTDVLYGLRYDYKAHARVYMLDTGIANVVWSKYKEKVIEHKPTLALTEDYRRGQYDKLQQQVADLAQLGVKRIAVCPKFAGAIDDIPAECVIAISVPTTYAGFLPKPDEVGDRQVHFLGGHPDQVRYLMTVYENVASVDMNVIGLKASLGQYWSISGKWQKVATRSVSTKELCVVSWLNIRDYLAMDLGVMKSARVHRLMYTRAMFADEDV